MNSIEMEQNTAFFKQDRKDGNQIGNREKSDYGGLAYCSGKLR